MTPSQQIVGPAMAVKETTDALGRRLKYRRLAVLDRARLFKAVGAQHSQNAPYVGLAMIAASCTAIDDIPNPFPTRENEIDAAIYRLGDEGMDAVASALYSDEMGTEDLTGDITAQAGPTPAT